MQERAVETLTFRYPTDSHPSADAAWIWMTAKGLLLLVGYSPDIQHRAGDKRGGFHWGKVLVLG